MKKSNGKKTRLRVFFDIVGYSLFGFIFVLVCIIAVQSFSGGHPNLFGYCYYYIQTGSMDGDYKDSFPAETIILSKMIDEDDCYDLVVGDIITFVPSEENLPSYITTKTHRIVEIDYENKTIVTKGDANTSKDKVISFEDVEAKFLKKSPLISVFYNFFSTFAGFLVLIVIPIVGLIIMQIYSFVLEKKKLDLKEEISSLEEKEDISLEEKKKLLEEQAIKEYLDSLKNDKK